MVGLDSALQQIEAGHVTEGHEALGNQCVSGSSSACALAGHSVAPKNSRPILQSVTTSNQSRFVIVIPRHSSPHYFVRGERYLRELRPERFQREGSNTAIDQVEALDLEPTQVYELFVVGGDGSLWDRRTFRSLDTAKRRARIAVTGGSDDSYRSVQEKIWAQILYSKPDVIFMIGQNVYPEPERPGQVPGAATPELIWRRYVENRENLRLFKANPLIPILATWDDQDFGQTNGDRTFQFKFESMDIFLSFFAQRSMAPGFDRGAGVSSWWKGFGVNFAFLDNRTYRSPDNLKLEDETHFGPEQERWISEQIPPGGTPVVLLSGDGFFTTEQTQESFALNHPRSFASQLSVWKKSSSPLLFVSGHHHSARIVPVAFERLGYSSFELQTGGLHNLGGDNSYLMLEVIRVATGFVQLDVQAYALDHKQLFQKTVMVKHP